MEVKYESRKNLQAKGTALRRRKFDSEQEERSYLSLSEAQGKK
jgi:hypothetical protein